jgi:hypothetical protein
MRMRHLPCCPQVAGLPPVTREWFDERRAQLASTGAVGQAAVTRAWVDPLTKKKFASENTWAAYTRSKKYQDLVKQSGQAAPEPVITEVHAKAKDAAPAQKTGERVGPVWRMQPPPDTCACRMQGACRAPRAAGATQQLGTPMRPHAAQLNDHAPSCHVLRAAACCRPPHPMGAPRTCVAARHAPAPAHLLKLALSPGGDLTHHLPRRLPPAAVFSHHFGKGGIPEEEEEEEEGDDGEGWETASDEDVVEALDAGQQRDPAPTQGSDDEEEEDVERNAWEEWDVCRSLFDNHVSKDMEANLTYMYKNFGFYYPDAEYLKVCVCVRERERDGV